MKVALKNYFWPFILLMMGLSSINNVIAGGVRLGVICGSGENTAEAIGQLMGRGSFSDWGHVRGEKRMPSQLILKRINSHTLACTLVNNPLRAITHPLPPLPLPTISCFSYNSLQSLDYVNMEEKYEGKAILESLDVIETNGKIDLCVLAVPRPT